MTKNMFIKLALSFADTESCQHFDRLGFKIKKKRMFASYLEKDNSANIFLTPEEQFIYCKINPSIIYPVPNKWGTKGATVFMLDKAPREIVKEALEAAYSKSWNKETISNMGNQLSV